MMLCVHLHWKIKHWLLFYDCLPYRKWKLFIPTKQKIKSNTMNNMHQNNYCVGTQCLVRRHANTKNTCWIGPPEFSKFMFEKLIMSYWFISLSAKTRKHSRAISVHAWQKKIPLPFLRIYKFHKLDILEYQ